MKPFVGQGQLEILLVLVGPLLVLFAALPQSTPFTGLCKAPIPGICDALRRYSTSRFRYFCEAPRHYEVSARFEIVITARAGLYRLRVFFAEDIC